VTIGMLKGEGDYIAMHLRGTPAQRPMTYQFMSNLLGRLGGRMLEARVSQVEGNTFYAEGVFEGPDGPFSLDARPSDVINLALRTSAPIRVASSVFDLDRKTPYQAQPPAS
jgi:uncharacterized protein